MSLISYTEYLEQEKRIYATANFTGNSDIIINRDADMFTDWNDLLGVSIPAGTVCYYEGIKYLVIQAVIPIISQPPNATGMLAIYKPYRDSGIYEWLSGEYVEIGWIRYVISEYEDIGVTIDRYKAIQDPGANIYSPDLTPSIWEKMENEDI